MRGVFGSSTAATAAVIGIFMGGLGLGGYFLGRVADRSGNALRLYATLEFGIALAALATIPLGGLVERIYFASGGSLRLGLGGATLLRLALAVVLLGIPTVLMGGTLPAAARAVVGEGDAARRAIALLYGINTLGAVVGVGGSTFFALEHFGNRATLVIAVVLNLVVATIALATSRRALFGNMVAGEPAGVPAPCAEREAPPLFTWIAAGVAGFCFLLLELVWYRMLAPILGGSTFTFGLILAAALFGIGLGGLLYALVSDNRPATLRLFALTCGLEAFAIVLPIALGDRLALVAAYTRNFDALGFGGSLFGWAILCSIVVVPAAIVSGFQFPSLIALAGRGSEAVGVDVGRVYAFNTLGAIAGSLAGGFGLMPLITATGCWRLAAWLMIVLCGATTAIALGRRHSAVAGPLVATAALVMLVMSPGPTAAWRHAPIGAGRANLTGMSRNDLIDWQRQQRRTVRWEADGVESSVAVTQKDGYAFLVNGKSDGHSTADAPTQVMGGLVGALLHPRPERSLVVGLGTGSTAGWLGSVPGMKRVDVAELEPAIADVARDCATVNQDVLSQKNVHVFFGDAREMLLVTNQRYDVIFSEPSNPYRAGIAGLFTTEFYAAVSGRLAEGGIFLQWVQAYEVDGATIETILKTLHGVFPHVQVWETMNKDLLLVATRKPLPVDANLIRQRVTQEPWRSALGRAWKAETAEEVLAHMVADDALAEYVARHTTEPVNSDDRNVVEFGFARSVGAKRGSPTGELRSLATALGMRDKSFRGTYDQTLVDRFRATSPLIAGADPIQQRDLAAAMGAYQQRRFADALGAWERTGLVPQSHYETLLVADSLAQTRDVRCLDYLEQLRGFDPVDALLVEAFYRAYTGDPAAAAQLIARGFELQRTWPWGNDSVVAQAYFVADMLVKSGDAPSIDRIVKSFLEPFAVAQTEERRRLFLLLAARRFEQERCGPRTVAALQLFEPETPWYRDFLETRSRCYAAAGSPLASVAREELEQFVRNEAKPFGADLKSRGAAATK
jgi:spermidine synthase